MKPSARALPRLDTMTTRVLPRLRLLALSMLGALIFTAALAMTAPSASAHDTLVDSSPTADSTVDTLPGELVLTFSAELIDGDGTTAVEVTGPDDLTAHAGAPVVDGVFVRVPLIAEAPAGDYHVIWRVVSSDGHPISGEFSFATTTSTIVESPEPSPEPTTAEPSPSAEPTVSATTAPGEETPADSDAFLRNLPWIILGLVVAAGGGAVIAVMVARSRRGGTASSGSHGR